jgi:hypothetical protein
VLNCVSFVHLNRSVAVLALRLPSSQKNTSKSERFALYQPPFLFVTIMLRTSQGVPWYLCPPMQLVSAA